MNLEDKGMASKFGQNQLIMKANSFAIACCLGILLTGCTYSTTSHSFKFYGSTQESFGRDFFYVQYGVTGAATAKYTSRGGGHVREGLIADAKRNLIQAHPLGPNQSYVNMSIDVSQTESGVATQGAASVTKVELTATISADVIQFGQPPVDYAMPVASGSGQIGGALPNTPDVPSIISDSGPLDDLIQSGDACYVKFGGEWFEGRLLKYGKMAGGGAYFRVKYSFNGKEKTGLFNAGSFSFELPQEADRSGSSMSEPTQDSPPSSLNEAKTEEVTFSVGDVVTFTVRLGEEATGQVVGIIQTPSGDIANVKYVYEGEERTSTLPVFSLKVAD